MTVPVRSARPEPSDVMTPRVAARGPGVPGMAAIAIVGQIVGQGLPDYAVLPGQHAG